MAQATTSTRAPRGTKVLTQAFFAAADAIPEPQRADVVKAALTAIRDEIKAAREKAAAAKAKVKSAAPTKQAAATAAKKAAAKPVVKDATKKTSPKKTAPKKAASKKTSAKVTPPPPVDMAAE
jgi:histone H1/5